MDRPVLHSLALELAAHERLQEFAAALPARARVSEPALPLLLAALHEHLGRALVCLLPEDADARDAAEAAGWFLGPEQVAFLPGRGVGWDSGLEPPPHLIGERVRALDVLAAGGLVCISAAALGFSARTKRKSVATKVKSLVFSAQRTVAVRGAEEISAISPKKEPLSSAATFFEKSPRKPELMLTSTLPS